MATDTKCKYVDVKDAHGQTIRFIGFDGCYSGMRSDTVEKNIPLQARTLKLRPTDIILCCYPKSGTHWLQEIVEMLVEDRTVLDAHRIKEDRMLEFTENKIIDDLPDPRIINTHHCLKHMPENLLTCGAKIIQIHRNPKDVFVSFYPHHRYIEQFLYTGDWSGYFPLALSGEIEGGSWFKYVKEWTRATRKNPNVLTLWYEQMKQAPLKHVEAVAKFIGYEKTNQFYEEVVRATSFESMKKTKIDQVPWKDNSHSMYRKGQIGDWKNVFTVDQNKLFDRVFAEEMADKDMKELVDQIIWD